MSDEYLNDFLDLWTPPYTREIIGYKSTVMESAGGTQQVVVHTTHDRMRYTLNLSLLTRSERDKVEKFFKRHRGRQDSFLWIDPVEWFVERTEVGTGTGLGGQTTQLKDQDGSKRWNILTTSRAPSNEKIWVDGGLQTGYSIDRTDSGLVTWTSYTPPIGEAIENEFYYSRRCRFVNQYVDTEVDYENVGVQLVFDEVKLGP